MTAALSRGCRKAIDAWRQRVAELDERRQAEVVMAAMAALPTVPAELERWQRSMVPSFWLRAEFTPVTWGPFASEGEAWAYYAGRTSTPEELGRWKAAGWTVEKRA